LYTISITAKEVMDKLKVQGWILDRITGSHHVFVKDGRRPVSVPFHGNKDIGNLAKRSRNRVGGMMTYHCTIEKERDEYIAQFPDITNIVTCGFSQDETLAMAKEALDGCLEAGYIPG
jgi:predicted RNA binding protein YcfA (HicA-like mRNA interferase family)/predicted RNase H-like HicB family nuclease